MLDMIFRTIIGIFCTVGIIASAILIEECVFPKVREWISGKGKVRCLCKHEYVKKRTWRHFEHDYSINGICESIDLQCRKCGKKTRIEIFEEEVI